VKATLNGWVRIEVEVEVEVDEQEGLTDLEAEELFNASVEEEWNRGNLADYDYSIEYDDEEL